MKESFCVRGMLIFGVIMCVVALVGGCDYLGFKDEETDIPDGGGSTSNPTPRPTGYPGKPGLTPNPTEHPRATPTPTPNNSGDAQFIVGGEGDRMEFNLGGLSSGTFHFEARGFDPNRYGGDTTHLKPVYFWLYNGLYDYECPGLLFEVRQLMYANYWCVGGKIKGRNNGSWRGEECYMFTWQGDRWISFDISWGGGTMALYIDGMFESSLNIGSISGNVIAGIGWPPARRDGIIGLEYRNMGVR